MDHEANPGDLRPVAGQLFVTFSTGRRLFRYHDMALLKYVEVRDSAVSPDASYANPVEVGSCKFKALSPLQQAAPSHTPI